MRSFLSLPVSLGLLLAVAIPGRLAAAPPAVPQGVAMVANSADSITLEWSRPKGGDVKSYQVFGSETKDGPFQRLATVTERTAVQRALKPGAEYFYKVTASNAEEESEPSAVAAGFTITPTPGAPFPVKVARNLCVSLGADIVSTPAPVAGKLASLVDGSDGTSCRLRKACEIKIRIADAAAIADAPYLLLNFRAPGGEAEWSNDPLARSFQKYVVIESADSTNGTDGTWRDVKSGTNELMDGVIVVPNTKPKWIGIRSAGGAEIPASDKRLMPGDLLLSRLDVFRAAPAGQRNDYWIFTGDSLVVQDMPAGGGAGRTAWFSDLVRQQHPDRYPIVVHAARGGEMLKDTLPRMKSIMAALSPANGTKTPTATVVCWETGFNDIGLSAGLWIGPKLVAGLTEAQDFCTAQGLFLVPVRIEFANAYLDPATLEPAKDGIFHNTLAANLAGVDVFCRTRTPYACDPQTQLPYADYWTYTRKNQAAVLVKDGVHHTKVGQDGINRLWAGVADRMIYAREK